MIFDEQTRKLTPSEGLWLTQKVLKDENERKFSDLMWLGISDSPDNYAEWTEEQKEQWEHDHPQPTPPTPEE